MTDRLLRLRDVEHAVALKKSAIYEKVKSGTFPAPVKIGNSTRWLEADIQKWIAALSEETA